MANESTSYTLEELYTEIVAEALFVASERSIMRPLVKNYGIYYSIRKWNNDYSY